MAPRPVRALAAAVFLSLAVWGCGGSSGTSTPPPPPSNVAITIFPDSPTVSAGANQQFFATVTGTSNMAVSWSATPGMITSTGLYTAPATVPNPPTASVTATSQADTSKSATASVTIVAQGVGDVNQARQSFPIKLGTSGGNQNDLSTSGNMVTCCSGTLGALVMRGPIQYILSNNHVLARTGQAMTGEAILQPGLVDTNCTANGNTVARFSQAAPLQTSNVDAAIAEVVSGAVDSTGAILLFGSASGGTIGAAPPASSSVNPTIGMPVAKSGRSTGLTCSSIGAINATVRVQYQQACGSTTKFDVTFTNQIVVNDPAFSSSGDSGSLIVKAQTAQPAALLFAGSTTNTIANPIQDALNALADPSPPGVVPTVVGGAQHSIACPASPSAAMAQASALSEAAIAVATAAKNKHAEQLMADPAVIGVGVGASDDSPGEAAIVLYVEQGKPSGAIPAQIDGVRTKVIPTEPFRAFGWNEKPAQACRPRP